MNRLKRKGMELVAWKDKKDKKSHMELEKATAPLWVYGNPTEETEWDFGIRDTPTSAESTEESFTLIKGSWTASLKIISNKGFGSLEEITHHVSMILDSYNGMNTNMRAYFVHLLPLIPHLGGRRDQTLDAYVYQGGYSEVIEFLFSNPDSPSNRAWAHSQTTKLTLGSLTAKIEYSVKFEPSIRKAVSFKMIYYSPTNGGKIPPMKEYSSDLSMSVDDSSDPVKIL
ncbi:matrix [Rochambeau virus]|uniref:Matrix n=1 Tax=Rochambeau virus TaxID=380435 RepID=A0A0D3R1H3_9RHAB|nr:matrix [Rochambeau virus]AJR28503.1 matrix [Rochambeau virus]